MSHKIKPSIVAGLLALVAIALVAHGRSSPYNNDVLLAQALLHGHTWITWPGGYIDALPYHGQYYIIEGPMPAVLLLPLVAIFGTFNQTWLAIVLGAIAVGAAFELGERWGVNRSANAWVCAFLLAGTDLLWCAMLGDVWFLAHVCAVCFTMLALVELAGARRGWLVALYASCALFARFDLVLALPVYAYVLWPEKPRLRSFAQRARPRRAGMGCLQSCALGHVVRHRLYGVVSPGSSRHAVWLALQADLFSIRAVVVLRAVAAAYTGVSVSRADN